jgi:hypothetical protein
MFMLRESVDAFALLCMGSTPLRPSPPPPLSVNSTVHEYLLEKEWVQTVKQAVYSQATCVPVSAQHQLNTFLYNR